MRICEVCGQPITLGCMTDGSGDWFAHEGPCFESYMDETYGKHGWMHTGGEVEDGEGGYYMVTDDEMGCVGSGIYYTEYEDEDEDEDENDRRASSIPRLVEVTMGATPPDYRELVPLEDPKDLTKTGLAWFTDRDPIRFIIHEGVTRFDVFTAKFQSWKSLTNIMIPRGITVVGCGAFIDCTNLMYVDLPDSLIKIELEAFRNCCNLRSLSIPRSVTYIGENVFQGCRKLTLCTPKDSYADIYAKENGFIFQKHPSDYPNLDLPNLWKYPEHLEHDGEPKKDLEDNE